MPTFYGKYDGEFRSEYAGGNKGFIGQNPDVALVSVGGKMVNTYLPRIHLSHKTMIHEPDLGTQKR